VNRSILVIALALVVAAVSAPAVAYADDPPPTPQQLEQAKKAFGEGKKLHDAGKLPEAIEKFKESYRLSKNPLLLYNIGLTMEEAQMEDLALFYYRKFLKDAPADAAQRGTVAERVTALEKKFDPNAGGGKEPAGDPNAGKEPTKVPNANTEPPKAAVKIKPPGTYAAKDFEHQVVETVPPGKPLDVTAFVPEDSGFVVTLYYRTAGEGKFTAKVMKWRYKELVGRIPAPKMIGNAVQYYIEVKDTTDKVLTRSGKPTSPNLVNLEAGSSPRFYPDFTDEGEAKPATAAETLASDDEDDPLNKSKKKKKAPPPTTAKIDDPTTPTETTPTTPGDGFRDVGSSKFKYAKWGTTIGAGALIGLGVLMYVQAGNFGKALKDQSTGCGNPPCAPYDDYDAQLEAGGKTRQTVSNVSLAFGIGAAAVAGYFWYRELTAKKRGELKVSKQGPSPEANASWVIAPSVGDSFMGAAAAARF
jgi:tetratricopeptide (TPR) repeat protein